MTVNTGCSTNKLSDALNEAINNHYAVNTNKSLLNENINQYTTTNIWLNKYNTLTTCSTLTYISDEELIAEVKRRKIPVLKLIQPEYNWKHNRLVTNNLRYLI